MRVRVRVRVRPRPRLRVSGLVRKVERLLGAVCGVYQTLPLPLNQSLTLTRTRTLTVTLTLALTLTCSALYAASTAVGVVQRISAGER